MAYLCDLGQGQRLYLDNHGNDTVIASLMSAPGQQQQSSSRFQTGAWTQPPQLFRSAQGAFVKLTTSQGEIYIQVQGQSLQLTQQNPSMQQAQQLQISVVEAMPGVEPMQPMPPLSSMPSTTPLNAVPPTPMKPLEPMRIGNMQMSLEPMQMQMGNMKMQMGTPVQPPSNQASPTKAVSNSVETSGTNPAKPDSAQSPPANVQTRFCTQCGQPVKLSDRYCGSCGNALEG